MVSACYILETFSQKGKTKTKLNQFTKNEPAVIMIIKNKTKKGAYQSTQTIKNRLTKEQYSWPESKRQKRQREKERG